MFIYLSIYVYMDAITTKGNVRISMDRINELLTIICITSCITLILTSAACFVIVASLMK